MRDSLKIAIAGATGYTGLELTKILSMHPKVKIEYLCAQKSIGRTISFFDKNIKKRKIKSRGKKNGHHKPADLQKVINFKLPTLGKFYKNFAEKRKKEKVKREKLKSKNREKQIKDEQKQLKEEEKQLKKEEEDRLKEINIVRIEQERKIREEQEEREKLDPPH